MKWNDWKQTQPPAGKYLYLIDNGCNSNDFEIGFSIEKGIGIKAIVPDDPSCSFITFDKWQLIPFFNDIKWIDSKDIPNNNRYIYLRDLKNPSEIKVGVSVNSNCYDNKISAILPESLGSVIFFDQWQYIPPPRPIGIVHI